MERFRGWFWFLSGHENLLERDKCGKWMYFLIIKNLQENMLESNRWGGLL